MKPRQCHDSPLLRQLMRYTKTSQKRTNPEGKQQEIVVRWLTAKGLDFFAVPNSVYDKNILVGMRLKREGKKAGVPDLIILNKPSNPEYERCVGVALEMKKIPEAKNHKIPCNCMGEEQIKWKETFKKNNWLHLLAHGADDAIETLEMLY